MTDNATPSQEKLEPRFFVDHGMIHDRLTGKHVTTAPDDEIWNGCTISDCCKLLNELSGHAAANRKEMKLLFTKEWLQKKIMSDPDIETEAGISHPEAPTAQADQPEMIRTADAYELVKRLAELTNQRINDIISLDMWVNESVKTVLKSQNHQAIRDKALDEAAHFVWQCAQGGKDISVMPDKIRALKGKL